MRTSLERRGELFGLLLPFALGGLLTAATIRLAQAGYSQAPPVPLFPPRVEVYDCINIQYSPPAAWYRPDHPAYYAFRRLQYTCEEQAHAVALMHIWETDPTAGVVIEPAAE